MNKERASEAVMRLAKEEMQRARACMKNDMNDDFVELLLNYTVDAQRAGVSNSFILEFIQLLAKSAQKE